MLYLANLKILFTLDIIEYLQLKQPVLKLFFSKKGIAKFLQYKMIPSCKMTNIFRKTQQAHIDADTTKKTTNTHNQLLFISLHKLQSSCICNFGKKLKGITCLTLYMSLVSQYIHMNSEKFNPFSSNFICSDSPDSLWNGSLREHPKFLMCIFYTP